MSGFSPSTIHVSDGVDSIEIKPSNVAATIADTAMVVEVRPGGSFPSKGSAAMTGSIPVTIATDDTISKAFVAVGGNPTANALNNIASTSIPSAATEGKAVLPWYTLNGARVSRLVDAVGGAIFPVAAAIADAASNTATVTQVSSRLSSYNGSTWDMVRSGLTAVQTVVTGMINTLPTGKYNATQPTLADTNAVNLQVDSRGNLRTVNMSAPQAQDDLNQVFATMIRPMVGTTYTHTLYTYYSGAVTKALILTGNRQAFSFTVTNRNAGVRYFGLHNKATAPAAGEAPLIVFMIPAASTLTIGSQFFTDAGINFTLGLGWAIGTTVATFTDSATASEHEVQVQYL